MVSDKKLKKFYVTTPIYYPNDIPHIGHAYTTVAADVLCRWNQLLLGKDNVFFLTGTDENAKKVYQAAQKAGISTKDFVDKLSKDFDSAWKKLNIFPNRFIRTTDEDHVEVVKFVLLKAKENNDIYKGVYEGYYCNGCEAYYTEKDLSDMCCPIHKTKVDLLKEESYFFKLSKYQDKLLNFYNKNPNFILPRRRSSEIINRVKEGLKDLSISRKDYGWGIKLPFDESHVCYVWYDALTNYLTGIGFNKDKKLFKKFWPADVHLVGKDILWFHSVIWPAMLISIGLEPPKSIFAHGWWTFDNEKISKSRGKVINVDELISIAGVDSARYFLFRGATFGEDGNFSIENLIEKHNTELANKFGNLISRVSALAEKIGITKTENNLVKKLKIKEYEKLMRNYELDKALCFIFSFIDDCNLYIQNKKPWETFNKKVLYELVDSIKTISILLWPFIPETCEKIASHIGFEINYKEIKKPFIVKKITKSDILFKKINLF
ncbi:MAG: methionine--tRNA ligase [Candidatus Pacearchaeota archaeon]